MNVIAGVTWSAGVPLSWVMFLYTCSAVLGSAAWPYTGCGAKAKEPAHTTAATAKIGRESLRAGVGRVVCSGIRMLLLFLWIVPNRGAALGPIPMACANTRLGAYTASTSFTFSASAAAV